MADDVRHRADVAQALLGFLPCLGVRSRSAVYVSAPITTGREYLEWRMRTSKLGESFVDEDTEHREQVVARNVTVAEGIVCKVRETFDAIVIDPTALADVPGWEQADYHAFWVELIERYVGTIVFVDGWQYSAGAALEFATGCRLGLRMFTQNLDELEPYVGLKLLKDASRAFHEVQVAVPVITNVVTELEHRLFANPRPGL